jgi:hypothetical protein
MTGEMITMLITSILALLTIGWVLCTNSKDRNRFEKELATDIADDPGDHA